MKVAAYNTTPENRNHYQCNVCGLYMAWSDNHRSIERPVGTGYAAYEALWITCSDKCRERQRELFIAWLSKYDGWDKATAAVNYDTYIKK